MDEIDITDSTFDLNQQVVGGGDEATSSSSLSSSSIYIYIAVAAFVVFIGYILYSTFVSGKGKKVTFQDKLEQCYGGSCGVDKCV
jgi:hypothetical protein